MRYRVNPKTGDRLSLLGLGCMRFTKKNGAIDQEKAEQVMAHALAQGINYFDTAWLYPGNEAAVGRFLAKGHRDEVVLATKMPQYKVKKTADFDGFFGEDRDEVTYLWSNRFDPAARTVTMDLTFFTPRPDGLYRRSDETHVQKAHAPEALRAMLEGAGFDSVRLRSDGPQGGAGRLYIIARRNQQEHG